MAYVQEGLWQEYDEERDRELLEDCGCLLLDVKESENVKYPLEYSIYVFRAYHHDMDYACDFFQNPYELGPDWRTIDGWVYIASRPTTEEQRKEREPKFKERIAPWIEDYGAQYNKYKDELMELYENFKKLDLKKLEDRELLGAWWDGIRIYTRAMEIHFVWMYAYATIYLMFEELCNELLGVNRHSREFNDLSGGFDHKVMDSDREIFRLAKLAQKLGLQPILDSTPNNEEALSKLKESKEGENWLNELYKFLDEYGWRTLGNWSFSTPTWREKPSVIFPLIRQSMSHDVFRPDVVKQELIERREKVEKEITARVPEDKREYFVKLMRSAQWAPIVEEEHVFYTENYGNAIIRSLAMEIGERFARRGIIEDPNDIFYLTPEEIEWRFIVKPNAKKLVNLRKKMVAEWKKPDPSFIIGDPSRIEEPFKRSSVLMLSVVPYPYVRPELNADLYGTVWTPGVVEGEVCVITSESEFHKFKPGCILVAPVTSSNWTPLFQSVKAVITDGGGALSHAQVVGREYGITVISGTKDALKKLKDGMKVRVDGDHGVVYILE